MRENRPLPPETTSGGPRPVRVVFGMVTVALLGCAHPVSPTFTYEACRDPAIPLEERDYGCLFVDALPLIERYRHARRAYGWGLAALAFDRLGGVDVDEASLEASVRAFQSTRAALVTSAAYREWCRRLDFPCDGRDAEWRTFLDQARMVGQDWNRLVARRLRENRQY